MPGGILPGLPTETTAEGCNHHWHQARDAIRGSSKGRVHAQCCRCDVTAWATLFPKKRCKSPQSTYGNMPLPRVGSFEILGGSFARPRRRR